MYERAHSLFVYIPLALYGFNEEMEFVPLSQYLYPNYSSVTNCYWSVRAEKK